MVSAIFATLALAAAIPDRTAAFDEIDALIPTQQYDQAGGLLAGLMNELLATKAGFAVGSEHEAIWRRGRENSDVAGLVRAARESWRQAVAGEIPLRAVMDQLSEALASVSQRQSDLPAAVRYQQARARHSQRPNDFHLLQQVTWAAFDARDWDATLAYIAQERAIAPKALQGWHGEFLHQRETMAGLAHLEKGEIDEAVACLKAAGEDLLQVKRANHYFTSLTPDWRLAQTLLARGGHKTEVVRYIAIGLEVRQPRHDMCMDGEATIETLLQDIEAGREPRFPRL